jgi:hypothetical protein
MKRSLLFLPFALAACDRATTGPGDHPLFGATTTLAAVRAIACFSGPSEGTVFGGTCTLTPTGVATLDNIDDNPNGAFSGVFARNGNLRGKLLADVAELGFRYAGSPATGGAPRISLPLDTNGDGLTDTFAFIAAFHCNDGASAVSGVVDAINDPSCTIFVGNEITGHENWAAFAAAHPTYTVGPDGAPPFVIADEPGVWTVSDVRLGRGAAGGL